MFKSLMTTRRFAPLFWCQFCSALNDNFLKNALAMLILFGIAGSGQAAGGNAGVLITLSGIIFIAPFFIFSALGGELADRFDKAYVAERVKLAEIPVAGLAAIGFFLHSVPILMLTLGLFGILASLFGPLKYGMLPEKLDTAELSAGNALVEGATFLAILIGTIAGGIAVAEAQSAGIVVLVIGMLAVASWLFARSIPKAGAGGARPRHHPQSLDLDRGAAARAAAGRPAPVGRRAHRVLVLAGRLRGAVAAAGPGQGQHRRQRGRGDAVPCHLHGRHCAGLGAGRRRQPRQAQPGAGAAGRHPDRRVLAGASAGWPSAPRPAASRSARSAC